MNKLVGCYAPHSRDPEVGPGEAWCRIYLPCWLCTTCGNKDPRVPRPGHLEPKTRMETLAKDFWVNLPANVEKRAFSASGRIVSPDPDFSSEANQHPLIELTSADQVQANSQVFSARAQRVVDYKGPIERPARRRQSFIKRFNY